MTPATDNVPPPAASAGRPRVQSRQRPGGTPREEILDAAAELFTRRGYSATSTRMIADAVGIRQASLYYHFTNKEALLEELLAGTVRPSLLFAETLRDPGPEVVGKNDDPILDGAGSAPGVAAPDARLFALAAFDTALLCGGRWNLGALYLLPEVRGERFAPFRAERAELRTEYGHLVAEVLARSDPLPGATAEELTDLIFGLVESVIPIRSEREALDVHPMALRVAAACLRLLGVPPTRIAQLTLPPLPYA